MTTRHLTAWPLHAEPHLSPRAMDILAVGTLIALYAVALLLIARRALGAFTMELPWQILLLAGLVALTIITGLRIVWRRSHPEPTLADPWIAWGSSITLLLVAGGLSFSGEQRDWSIWLPILISDQFIRRQLFENVVENIIAKPQAARSDQVQHIVRTRDAAGRETVRATLRADFQAEQRHATVYVGFCPPLADQPEITIEPIEGAETKIVQAFPHGVRMDVRLAEIATEPLSLAINVVARA